MEASYEGSRLAEGLRDAVRSADPNAVLIAQLDSLAGSNAGRGRGRFGPQGPPNFRSINGALVGQLNEQEQGDRAPTEAALAAFAGVCHDLSVAAATWQRLSTTELKARGGGGSAIAPPAGKIKLPSCM
jgi:hypothetical protein